MSVRYIESKKTFLLQTKNSTYQMKVSDYGYLLHLYYGERLEDEDLSYLIQLQDRGFSPNPNEAGNDRTFSLDFLPQEFSSDGSCDYRLSSIEVKNGDGSYAFVGKAAKHEIYAGKYSLDGLPSLWAADQDRVDTLEIWLTDPATQLTAVLCYSVFEEKDIITRAVKVINESEETIYLNRIMSMTMDFMDSDYDFIHFDGRHTMEREWSRNPLAYGIQNVGSFRGASSHQHNPFAILCERGASEDDGRCYGFSFVYSGNFMCKVEKDQYDQTRIVMGIHPKHFSYQLKPGERFTAPEVVLAYSGKGLTHLTHLYHRVYRENLCKSPYVRKERPILINSWEAAYFDFDEAKLLEIAKEAVDMGVELFVLDDGWFGNRNDDNAALGDWDVNTAKLPRGLGGLSEDIHEMGLNFGLWIEPEMVSENSGLYRKHPDWCLQMPRRQPSRGRYQLVLDLSREDVRDYIVTSINSVLDSARIEYVKWDMNRFITDAWSAIVEKEKQGEIYHRYILGLYDIMNRIILTHPEILFCGCSGGGGRFDPGMLYYQPQIWCSDNTDAVCRLKIQYGTTFVYPVSAMESHVSVCPNHQTGRTVPLETRGITAMDGILGYELDSTKLTEEEKRICRQQVEAYKRNYPLIVYGDYYRLTNPYTFSEYVAWEHVSQNRDEALISLVLTEKEANDAQRYVKAKGLNPQMQYQVDGMEGSLSGQALMSAGLPVPGKLMQYEAVQYHIKAL
ncbi:bifunctional alpha-galactosidase/sucrose kinase AgaSK [Lachnospiraceae bacterium]|nr:bifunctional alpha-galactosidase/sucrose kinase AgaSK [Lachnospiraceae bacterium]